MRRSTTRKSCIPANHPKNDLGNIPSATVTSTYSGTHTALISYTVATVSCKKPSTHNYYHKLTLAVAFKVHILPGVQIFFCISKSFQRSALLKIVCSFATDFSFIENICSLASQQLSQSMPSCFTLLQRVPAMTCPRPCS